MGDIAQYILLRHKRKMDLKKCEEEFSKITIAEMKELDSGELEKLVFLLQDILKIVLSLKKQTRIG